MKFTLPVTLLAVATSVEGAVVQEGKCWCHSRGQACDTVKRAADAFAEALKSTANVAARDESDSKTATLARRQIDELALTIAASQYDPYSFYSGLQWGAHNKTEEQKTNERREAEAQWKRSAQAADRCQRFPGQPCWKRSEHKREPAAEAADWISFQEGQAADRQVEMTTYTSVYSQKMVKRKTVFGHYGAPPELYIPYRPPMASLNLPSVPEGSEISQSHTKPLMAEART
ncbi:hypothetical protein VTI74DRAFT_10502 [Chaetomium olivicolor]